MIARYVQKGEAIDYRPSEAVSAGDVVVLGNLVGVARLDIAADTLGALAVTGCFDVVKAAGAVTVGAAVYWDAANHKATVTAAGNRYLGKAVLSAESADEQVRLLLNAPYDTDTNYGSAASDTPGLVRKGAAVADCAFAGESATNVETQLNALLASLRAAGIIAGA